MSDPIWKLIDQLGDTDPVEYGGFFIFIDESGEHDPQGEYWAVPDDESEPTEIYRWNLTRCTYVDNVLSDNQFHPDFPAWFASLIEAASESCDYQGDIIADLCGEDLLARARAYETIGDFAGFRNFDDYPLQLNAEDLAERYEQLQELKDENPHPEL